MGNGGGGTIVFGVGEEKVGEVSIASSVVGLNDRSLIGRLENLVFLVGATDIAMALHRR